MTMDRVSPAFPPPDADVPAAATGDVVRRELTDLIHACQDARQGYERAAEEVGDQTYASAYRMYGQQRAQFAAELADAGAAYGVEWDESGTVEGGFRRTWLKLKGMFTGGDAEEVTEAIIQIEEDTLAEYEDTLEHRLPPNVEGVVRRQYNVIAGVVTQLKQLEEAADGAD